MQNLATYWQTENGEVYSFQGYEPSGTGWNQISKKEYETKRRAYCKDQLQSMLPQGSTVYCILRSVSSSGMQRQISLYCIHDGELRNIDGYVSDLLGRKIGKKDGIICNGCGMDMGFDLVYNLSFALFDGDRAGYNLRHSWL